MSRLMYWGEKAAYVAIAFVAIIAFYTVFKMWSEGKLNYFLFTGNLESAAIIFILIFGLGWVLKSLWKWEVHQIFRPRSRGR
ncbi:MAG: hypothetical protein AABW99_02740 [archaeon]